MNAFIYEVVHYIKDFFLSFLGFQAHKILYNLKEFHFQDAPKPVVTQVIKIL